LAYLPFDTVFRLEFHYSSSDFVCYYLLGLDGDVMVQYITWIYVFNIQIEKELNSVCGDVLDVLEKHLIPAATSGESKVFYYKM